MDPPTSASLLGNLSFCFVFSAHFDVKTTFMSYIACCYYNSPNKGGVEELWHVLREAIGMRRLAVS